MSSEAIHRAPSAQELNLVELLSRLVASRWLILRNVLVAAIATGVLSFLLPRRYTAVTTLLPPAEAQQTALQGMLAELPAVPLGFPKAGSPAALFVEILKSRSVREMVLQRTFSRKKAQAPLLQLLRAKSLESGLDRLARCTTVYASDQGIISIKVEMPEAQLAADVANAMVDALDQVNREKSVSRAKNSRLYIEQQLAQTEVKLREASKALAEFQETHKAIALEEQTKAAIESAGDLKGRIIAKQVELGTLRLTMRPDNPQVILAQRELEEMQARYNALQFGEDSSSGGNKEFYIPIAELPEVARQLAELIREVKVQETVWELLNQQYYQAKIQEARDTPTVQQLDRAVPPERASKPRRMVLVVIAGVLTGVLSALWVLVVPLVSLAPMDRERLQGMGKELAGDWQRLRRNVGEIAKLLKRPRGLRRRPRRRARKQ
ncbi:MAG: Wzz/FepE/Etk N-terminal domain-containing protein [candidate division KSB1 bacterium]|nr:Wzz/FepE/Etk N-terminal domain-containing protein [candidate division KSB1 bacterium]MDZ7338140.1 Wzz/FepE/Etk N-terminal domain-containing protein [candidate division KSB1 bacterium]MDZ7385696.1 Wzz/FepE/Etk N-terminal domain-containing protein [candidate division KSB1 bacterium]MDZ7391595.1 Wzz/FepE/Etk N-terminal domain-containing protein [candidate division KSB1 bacterium]